MIKIHPIRTGSVRIKRAQRVRRTGGLLRVLLDTTWTEWLPIHAWLIEHPEGPIVVDSGETARTAERGYFPRWHPYYRTSVQMNVRPEDEIGPQLEAIGVRPAEVRTVILTHFHTDHAGGLAHFPRADVLVSGPDYGQAKGVLGRLLGYLPNRWPGSFRPSPIAFSGEAVGAFPHSHTVTHAGDVVIVPTPGHTPGHVSVMVQAEDVTHFLAGDTSYTEHLLVRRTPDGVSPRPAVAIRTMDRILAYARERPMVYLPTHDPDSLERLAATSVLRPDTDG